MIQVNDILYSDHRLVKIYTTYFSFNKGTARTPQVNYDLNFSNFNLKDVDYNLLNNEFVNVNWEKIVDGEIEDFPFKFRFVVYSILAQHCKLNVTGKNRKTLFSRKRKILNRKIQKLKHRLMFSNANRKERSSIINNINKMENEKKNIFLCEVLSEEEKAIAKISMDNKYFFKYVNRDKFTSNSSPKILINKEGKAVSDPEKIADLLQNQYESVFSTPLSKLDIEKYSYSNPLPNTKILPLNLTNEHIVAAIDEIKPNSSCSPADIPAKVFKGCKFSLSKPLTMFWKKSLECGKIPSHYKNQIVKPIHKKGPKVLARNWRPVALTPHEVKIIERVFRGDISSYLESNHMINENQHGFRKNHSCTTQLMTNLDFIFTNAINGDEVDSIYIDYAKAFDKVDHGLLIHKLKGYGIVGEYLSWITDFLNNRFQTVCVNNCFSYTTSVKSGVPQGSVLGPLLFIIYINDLPSFIDNPNVKIYTFADDTKLVSKIASEQDVLHLQHSLNSVIEWSHINNMQLNQDKFKLLLFDLATSNANLKLLNELPFNNHYHSYSASDFEILPSEYVRDLGVFLDNQINWNIHYHTIYQKSKRISGWILSSFYSRNKVPMLVLFTTLVRPILEYGCVVTFPYLKKDIVLLEQIQRSFTSKIFGFKDLNYWERLEKLDIRSLQRRREKLIITHIWKIKNGLYPNNLTLEFKLNRRSNAMKAVLRPLPKVKGALLTKYEESFLIQSCKLWNVLPPSLTHVKIFNSFKAQLNVFCKSISDKPPLPGYPFTNNNSLVEQCLEL